MNRELLLLRHGKSSWNNGLRDFERPLKDRGKRGAQRMGNWLLQNDLIPDYIISSPATRAIETARKCCKVMGIPAKAIHQDQRIYMGAYEDLLAVIHECPEDPSRILLVGHNPGMAELLEFLVQEPLDWPEDGKLLPTATLAHLQVSDPWNAIRQGSADLLGIIRSRTLPRRFPWPAIKGSEQRDRPAYYYTQSSLIPYRIHNGRIEILIIRSSQDKHWVVPKGIVDPGSSPQESAAKEAREEAGVEGIVNPAPLGSYEYDKWGAICTVTVYAMKVTHILDESEWEETHRGRVWVSIGEAGSRLHQKKLLSMLQTLLDRLPRDE
jgi:phosphohistidine phosphatase